jgi:hypothetical protein
MKALFLFISLVFLSSCLQGGKKSALVFEGKQKDASASDLEQSGLAVRMADRYYVTSLILDVFGPDIKVYVDYFINVNMDHFGGGCDQYDFNVDTNGTCLNANCNLINCYGTNVIHNQIGASSVIRQGWTTRTCEEITNYDPSILYAIRAIHDQPGMLRDANLPAPTNTTLTTAYGLFFRSTAPNTTVIKSLAAVADAETGDNFEKWRYVLLSLCVIPEWQIP